MMKFLELKIPPLLVLAVFVLAAGLMAVALSEKSIFADPALMSAAIVGLIMGAGVALAGVYEFRKHQTTVNPLQANNASRLVTTGIYQRTRNPMYVGFVLILAGWCLALGVKQTLWLLPLFVVYLNYFQIKPEERILSSKFPETFSDYCEKVGRWWG